LFTAEIAEKSNERTDAEALLRRLVSRGKRVRLSCPTGCYADTGCQCGRVAFEEALAQADQWLRSRRSNQSPRSRRVSGAIA
jgi:hypothetical protein